MDFFKHDLGIPIVHRLSSILRNFCLRKRVLAKASIARQNKCTKIIRNGRRSAFLLLYIYAKGYLLLMLPSIRRSRSFVFKLRQDYLSVMDCLEINSTALPWKILTSLCPKLCAKYNHSSSAKLCLWCSKMVYLLPSSNSYYYVYFARLPLN